MKPRLWPLLGLQLVFSTPLVATAKESSVTPSPTSPLGTAGTATDPATATPQYKLADAHLLAPFWRSPVVYGESILAREETPGGPITGTLLLEPGTVLRVRSSDGATEYQQGKDYTVDANNHRLVIPPGSRIPFITTAELYKKKGEPNAISHKLGDPDTFLFHKESGFAVRQVVVDYKPVSRWTGFVPAFAGATLPKTIAKLKSGKGLNLAITGDSISTGANASRTKPPFQPAYPELLQLGLQKIYGGKVTLSNFSKGGEAAGYGLANIGKLIETRPDLVIIAFGMNDAGGKNPAGYQKNIKGMIDAIHAALPQTEIILVSTSLANPEWSWSSADQFPPHQAALKELTGPGIALADATALWTDVMKQKRYLDITGNGINHPNDFAHRLYAQLLLALLVDPATATAAQSRL